MVLSFIMASPLFNSKKPGGVSTRQFMLPVSRQTSHALLLTHHIVEKFSF